jgi:2-polyprenyl-6-hydroxyphenyl methylase/3-demethylubiquinone-9 3-methyltransferase
MPGYYEQTLAGERLRRCYEVAPQAVRRYLEAEIAHVHSWTRHARTVLELGCGYGRVLRELAREPEFVVGIDTSPVSLELANSYLADVGPVNLAVMDAVRPGFELQSFDVVCCVQNGISAFAVDQRTLLSSAVALTRPGGTVLFSSYADRFWPARLEWFRIQSAEGLVGEIDEAATGDGVIVCRDGFRSTTVGPARFRELADGLGSVIRVREVDGSSVFCEITV